VEYHKKKSSVKINQCPDQDLKQESPKRRNHYCYTSLLSEKMYDVAMQES
jgi:hypothetical protein